MGSILPNPESIDNTRWDWQKRAACNGAPAVDQHTFTGDSLPFGRNKARVRDLSTRYCNNCPVLAECYAWAESDETFIGVAAARMWTREDRERQSAQRTAAQAEQAYEEWKRG